MNRGTISWLVIATFCFSLFFMACQGNSNQGQPEEEQEEILPDTTIDEGMVMSEDEKACQGMGITRICEEGLAFARLQSDLRKVSIEGLEGAEMQDKLNVEGGYQWRVRTIKLPEGEIRLEGDFVDEREKMDSTKGLEINRIQIETPLFKTVKGLSVGSTVADLIAAYPEEEIKIFSDPIYEVILIMLPKVGRVIYNVYDKGNALHFAHENDFTIDKLPADTPIGFITVANVGMM